MYLFIVFFNFPFTYAIVWAQINNSAETLIENDKNVSPAPVFLSPPKCNYNSIRVLCHSNKSLNKVDNVIQRQQRNNLNT